MLDVLEEAVESIDGLFHFLVNTFSKHDYRTARADGSLTEQNSYDHGIDSDKGAHPDPF